MRAAHSPSRARCLSSLCRQGKWQGGLPHDTHKPHTCVTLSLKNNKGSFDSAWQRSPSIEATATTAVSSYTTAPTARVHANKTAQLQERESANKTKNSQNRANNMRTSRAAITESPNPTTKKTFRAHISCCKFSENNSRMFCSFDRPFRPLLAKHFLFRFQKRAETHSVAPLHLPPLVVVVRCVLSAKLAAENYNCTTTNTMRPRFVLLVLCVFVAPLALLMAEAVGL